MRVLLPLITFILLATVSCCKVGCVYQSLQLFFIGYNFRELDSTLIRKYEPNTNFTVLIDSIYRNSSVSDADTVMLFLDDGRDGLDLSKDYQVVIRGSGKTYSISGIVTDRFKCPCEPKKGRFVAAYTLDGTRHEGGEIYLNR